MGKQYFVYILTNGDRHTVLYVGVTNSLERRSSEHCDRLNRGFTHRYNVTKLVYVEVYDEVIDALAREKQIKGWTRAKKEALIATLNPGWLDLWDVWSKPYLKGSRI
ncbi:MAG: GIY-YIG nuclease family protein [Thermoanaerobaculia bacterium]